MLLVLFCIVCLASIAADTFGASESGFAKKQEKV